MSHNARTKARAAAFALLCALSTGCYEGRTGADAASSGLASEQGADAGRASRAGVGGTFMESERATPRSAAQRDEASAARAGAGGCGAILAPGEPNVADGSAFQGIGGAGFELVGVCDRCGFSHDDEQCRSLVYSVPTIDTSAYRTCGDTPFSYVDCLLKQPCICSGVVPAACRALKDALDACQ